ncbi:hypothetical protein SNL152K_9784 [Streptomyces sp. NL15-2K]|nr:hypothetical protein SNL152K_9784 [Streptomyces sp. NL15-2K]
MGHQISPDSLWYLMEVPLLLGHSAGLCRTFRPPRLCAPDGPESTPARAARRSRM